MSNICSTSKGQATAAVRLAAVGRCSFFIVPLTLSVGYSMFFMFL